MSILSGVNTKETHPLEGAVDRRLEVEGGTPVVRLVFLDLASTASSVWQVDLALGHVKIKSGCRVRLE